MLKTSWIHFLLSTILVLVVIATETFDCMYQELPQRIESSVEAGRTLMSFGHHTCDVDVSGGHVLCHTNHLCKAETECLNVFLFRMREKTYFSKTSIIYKNPFIDIFLKPPILS